MAEGHAQVSLFWTRFVYDFIRNKTSLDIWINDISLVADYI